MSEQVSSPVIDTSPQAMAPAVPSGPSNAVIDSAPATGFKEADAKAPSDTPKLNLNFPSVDFSDFDKVKNGIEIEKKGEPKEEEEKAEVEAKTESVVEAPPAEVGIKLPGKTGSRDLTGLDDSEKRIFKSMSNEAFDKLQPIYKEYKNIQATIKAKDAEIQKLKSSSETLPPTYFTHPEAYIFSPQFKETKAIYDAASLESRHWEQQLANIENGGGWQDLNIDPRTGEYVTTDPLEVNDSNRGQVKAQLMGYITQARLAINENYGKLRGLISTHQQKNKDIVSSIKTKEEEFFPAYKDQNFKGWKHAKEFLTNLPPEITESSPISSIAAKLYATVVLLNEENQVLKQRETVKKEVREDQRRAGPTAASFTGSQAGKPDITFDDFRKLHEY